MMHCISRVLGESCENHFIHYFGFSIFDQRWFLSFWPRAQFHAKTVKTVEEACELIEVGFEYVTTMDGVQIFRKRK